MAPRPDGYTTYKTVATANKAITLAFCWSHVRREFIELAKGKTAPIATETLQRIAALYADRLGNLDKAVDAYRDLLDLAPDSMVAMRFFFSLST